MPSAQHGLLSLQSHFSDQALGVSTPAGQGYMKVLLCKDTNRVKSNTKGKAWIKSVIKEIQMGNPSVKALFVTDSWVPSGLTAAVWSGSWLLYLFTFGDCHHPPCYVHCNVLQVQMRDKTHLKLSLSLQELSLLAILTV